MKLVFNYVIYITFTLERRKNMFDSGAEIGMLVERFHKGEFGKRLKELMDKKEVKEYFEKVFLPERERLKNQLREEAREVLEMMEGTGDLWEEFEVNFIANAFRQAVLNWCENKLDLEKIILAYLSEQNLQAYMEFYTQRKILPVKTLLAMQNGEISINSLAELQKILQNGQDGQEEQDSSSKSSTYVMPKDKKSSNYLN